MNPEGLGGSKINVDIWVITRKSVGEAQFHMEDVAEVLTIGAKNA
jgi:hypothetical protein